MTATSHRVEFSCCRRMWNVCLAWHEHELLQDFEAAERSNKQGAASGWWHTAGRRTQDDDDEGETIVAATYYVTGEH